MPTFILRPRAIVRQPRPQLHAPGSGAHDGELLTSVGLTVEVAGDGERAVALATTRAYDLVLMDVQMPSMDGLSATRIIRERIGRRLPIVAMTANAFGDERAACLASGMNDHVAKPVDPALLYTTLLRWLPNLPASGCELESAISARGASLRDRFADVVGLDIDRALRGLRGDVHLLERVMRKFVNNYGEGEPVLLEPMEAGIASAWLAASHSLRGACSAIGAMGLERALLDFEQATAASPDDPKLGQQAHALQDGLMDLVAQLRHGLDRNAP